jgi:hypothetical protein
LERPKNWLGVPRARRQAHDLCVVDPGFDVDLYVSTDLRTMTEIWLGYIAIGAACEKDQLVLTGDNELAASLRAWLKLSVFAEVEKQVA